MKAIVKGVLALLASLLIALSMVTLSAGFASASSAVPSASGVLSGLVGGSAYAGYLNTGVGSSVASVGPLFPISMGCEFRSPLTVDASALSMSLGTFARSSSLDDKATTSRTHTSATVQASSTVQKAKILAGLISATTVHAVATSNATPSTASSTGGATFVNLVIAGKKISGTPAPNTTITLAGLGSVVLNEQSGPVNGVNFTSISVTAIDIQVKLANTFGLPIGTHILIAHAQSSFTRTSFQAVINAGSYGLYALGLVGSGFVKSGPYAFATTSCTGGSNKVSVTSVSVPVIGSTGTITDKAFGQIKSSGPSANSSSTVQQVNLLKGLIVADMIKTTANAAFSNGNGSASATTTLVNAKVAGVSISANPAPNTKIIIANLGYVYVNEQYLKVTSMSATAQVSAFDLYVTTANSFGLPVGTRIIVARSYDILTLY